MITAAVLLLATALIGGMARGKGGQVVSDVNEETGFRATKGPVTFTGTLDRKAVQLGKDGTARMELVVEAASGSDDGSVRRDTDLVIVLDRSGSMSGIKMDQARESIREILTHLSPRDRFALVTYANGADLSIPLTAVDARMRDKWLGVVAGIQPSGGTDMSSGLDVGLDVVERSRGGERVPHVILISDGLANQGDPSLEGLTARARRAAVNEFMLSTVGVGSDFNEYLMTAIADAGTGNYYYVRSSADLGEVFAREFDAARTTVAAGLALRIEPAPGVTVVDVGGYPLERSGGAIVVRPGSLYAGQKRHIWVNLHVPHDELGEHDIGRFSVSYGGAGNRTTLSPDEVPRIACVRSEEEFFSNVDVGAWSRSVVVDSYNKMQADVAREVKAGRRDEALRKLYNFRDQTAGMNERLKSPAVAGQLLSADKLEADVQEAFEGEDQAIRQNELSKSKSAAAMDARRIGSKK
jgi:Ca-activated chloride channel family protein